MKEKDIDKVLTDLSDDNAENLSMEGEAGVSLRPDGTEPGPSNVKEVLGLKRDMVRTDAIPGIISSRPLGALFAFVTQEDAHSPVMLPVYDELVGEIEGVLPLYIVECELIDKELKRLQMSKYLIMSAPTLVWVRQTDDSPASLVMRIVGTTTLKKLVADTTDHLEAILDSAP